MLDRHGIARELSLPADGDVFQSDILDVLPRAQRRAAQPAQRPPHDGRHVPRRRGRPADPGRQEGGPARRRSSRCSGGAVDAAGRSAGAAVHRRISATQAHTWLSLLLRPIVCPEVPGFSRRQTMEVRFFAPGSLVSNLDFVESIFGNAGDPYLPRTTRGSTSSTGPATPAA